MATIFLQTDKSTTKDLPCVGSPTCQNWCRVTTFYAPAKARCPEHGGTMLKRLEDADTPPASARKELTTARAEKAVKFERAASVPIATIPDVPATPNQSLRHLCCPFDGEKLDILATEGAEEIVFGCQTCQAVVIIRAKWRVMQIRSIPERLQPLVAEFNLEARPTLDMSLARQMEKTKASKLPPIDSKFLPLSDAGVNPSRIRKGPRKPDAGDLAAMAPVIDDGEPARGKKARRKGGLKR